ncbi:transglycosylase SLT domain-containing protein [Microbacterium sp. H1-D42]|uniref:aggregation-promoting factor C-terminal-like domain-containing protein n=1 Tax=Microbacterium sp. H1-D42 TaxID=2925844 RepID=UPI001F53457A|nr:transglycosylase SLT domain-containing protein [Microbacterium sp. H1-D42]UNK69361.1 lytic transglycosylase domain-containing protein [Microbacterium sp. H1-D42]
MKKPPARRRASALLAGLAVVGFSAAMIAPTGMAVADPTAKDATQTAFSLAADDTQSITVSVEGAQIEPVVRSGFEVYVKPKPKPKPKPAVASSDSGGSGGGSVAPPRYSGGGSKEEWMAGAGIAASDYGYVDYIVSRESGWNPNATNSSSGACGLVQALPCSKVPGNGYNPVDNLRWGNGYAVGRYGSWANAYNFWTRNHWW